MGWERGERKRKVGHKAEGEGASELGREVRADDTTGWVPLCRAFHSSLRALSCFMSPCPCSALLHGTKSLPTLSEPAGAFIL